MKVIVRDFKIRRGECRVLGTRQRNGDGSERKEIIARLRHGAPVALEQDGENNFYAVHSQLGCVGVLSPDDTNLLLKETEAAITIHLALTSAGQCEFLTSNGRLWVEYAVKSEAGNV